MRDACVRERGMRATDITLKVAHACNEKALRQSGSSPLAPGYGMGMTGPTTYKITIRRELSSPGRYRWIYRCDHRDCGGADHQTACRDAACTEQRAAGHAGAAHPGDQVDIIVEPDG
jgi:hypothetical protein